MNLSSLLARSALFACVLAWNSAPVAARDNRLGRLFYTPEERQRLDQRRGAPAEASAPQMVMVNGVIIRPGMAPILFLNGKEVRKGEGPAGVTMTPQANQSIRMQSDGGPSVSARPGQTVDLSNGRSIDNYQLTMPPLGPPAASEPLNVESSAVPGLSVSGAHTREKSGNSISKSLAKP